MAPPLLGDVRFRLACLEWDWPALTDEQRCSRIDGLTLSLRALRDGPPSPRTRS